MPRHRKDHVKCPECFKNGIRRRPTAIAVKGHGIVLKCLCGYTYTSYSKAAQRLEHFIKPE